MIVPGSDEERVARNAGVLVFETAHDERCSTLNELHFYTWGDEDAACRAAPRSPRSWAMPKAWSAAISWCS